MNIRRSLKTLVLVLVKLGITALAFYLIAQRIDISQIKSFRLQNVNFMVLAEIGALCLVLLQILRWHYVLRVFGIDSTLKQDMLAVWFGHLLNNTLPTSAAGDLIRSFTLRYRGAHSGKWFGVFFAEKYCAIVTVLVLASITALVADLNGIPQEMKYVPMVVFVGLVVGVFCIKLVVRLGASFLPGRLLLYLTEMYEGMRHVARTGNGRAVLLISLLISMGMCTVFYLVSIAAGISIHPSYCFFVVPVFTILSALPISYGGWGIRELSSVQLLGLLGVPAEQALMISILYGLAILLSSIPGIFFISPFIRATRSARATFKQTGKDGYSLT